MIIEKKTSRVQLDAKVYKSFSEPIMMIIFRDSSGTMTICLTRLSMKRKDDRQSMSCLTD